MPFTPTTAPKRVHKLQRSQRSNVIGPLLRAQINSFGLVFEGTCTPNFAVQISTKYHADLIIRTSEFKTNETCDRGVACSCLLRFLPDFSLSLSGFALRTRTLSCASRFHLSRLHISSIHLYMYIYYFDPSQTHTSNMHSPQLYNLDEFLD